MPYFACWNAAGSMRVAGAMCVKLHAGICTLLFMNQLPLLETVVSVTGYTVVADLDTTRHPSNGVDVVNSTPISCTNKPLFTRLFGFPRSIHLCPFSTSKLLLPRSIATSMFLSAQDLPKPSQTDGGVL